MGIAESERYSYHPQGENIGMEPPGSLIGWFAPDYKTLAPVWDELKRRLGPLIVRCNESDHVIELCTGTVIRCWHLDNNPDAGRGYKFDLIVVDEAGMIEHLKRWMQSTADATLIDRAGRYLILSTPHTSPDFDELFDEAEAGSPEWAAFSWTTFDNPHLPRAELEKIMEKRATMPDWLWLREYMAVPPDAAGGFFARSLIMRCIEKARPPTQTGRIEVAQNGMEDFTALRFKRAQAVSWRPDPGGQWKLWALLRDGRPRQDVDYGFGIDIGAGVGAANSVISVGEAGFRRKVGEYACPGITPERLAQLAAAAGYWFGGPKGCAMIQFEVNGPGEVFAREMMRLGYPRLCQHQAENVDITQRSPSSYGWRSSPQAKETLLSEYREALASEFQNPSEAALRECLTYCYDKAGRLVSVSGGDDMLAEIARVPHGDRTIADALLWECLRRLPRPQPVEILPPVGSVGWAHEMIEKENAPKAPEEDW